MFIFHKVNIIFVSIVFNASFKIDNIQSVNIDFW